MGMLLAVLATGTASSQTCDSTEIQTGASERCVRPGAGKPFRDCPICPELVAVPAGPLTMGAETGERVATSAEDRVTGVIAKPFAVGRFAVTRGEFSAFVDATGHKTEGRCKRLGDLQTTDLSWKAPGFLQSDRHPVVCINWSDAKAYVAWLSRSTGKSYRLLSEAEREYVTRAGSRTPFWWGDTISTDQANYNGTITYGDSATGVWRKATVAVDSFGANPWGLYNVHGNVWEWTEDCWNPANAGNSGDGTPRLTGDCKLRVVRGAAFNNAPHTLRSARREREPAASRIDTFGFRVARTL